MKRSGEYFTGTVWPFLEKHCPAFQGHVLSPKEMQPEAIGHAADMIGGVDYWVTARGQMYSIATRVQWVEKDYKSFTIRCGRSSRCDTEMQKRLAAHVNDALSPSWTVQAYIDPATETLRRVGVIRTKELVEWILNYVNGGGRFNVLRSDDGCEATFIPVWWSALKSQPSFWCYPPERVSPGSITFTPWPDHRTPECNHGMHLDSPGNTWVDEQAGSRVRVVCKHCGKFYGYKR